MSAPAPPALRSSFSNYLALTKPRILPLVLFTALPVMGMATGGWPALPSMLVVLLGIAVAAAAANTLNMYIERDRDALMERTRTRPLPMASLGAGAALVFGLVLAVISTGILYVAGGPTAAFLGVASILFYVFVYTIWLKPRSVYNAVIGGAAGAAAPLIADAAINGSVGVPGLLLFSIVFLWQPPHVWAIALYRSSDYAAAGIPMMPAVIGPERTRWRMLWYTFGLVAITLLPIPLGLLGGVYAVAAVILNLWFVWVGVQLIRERTDDAARRVFFTSLVYLFLLYGAMIADLLVR
ncbi:MAG: protoheme IX farnesyltransferase [Deltaproteobacteria bacterium]|nr:protoheme IX farnesyltransferase [Deltaproteobacteria bacterium]MBW2396887.1 protoheme IX farnesyltransferase [Deltaproteobacteria bacterium]